KSDDLYDLLQPQQRKKQHGHLNHRHLYRTARNLSLAMEAIHRKKYVIGDVNFKNALFNDDALITIVDCDSMQVTDANGIVHRCIVGMPEYTPPELQGKDFNQEIRTANHDAFGLAVLIFQLLMQGFHPFTGRARPGVPDVEQSHVHCIRQQIFPYLDNQPYEPPRVAPSFYVLPGMLQTMFIRAFTHVQNRPTPKEWAQIISMIEKRLVQCTNDSDHFYPSDGACVICEIEYNSGRRVRTSPAPKPTVSTQVPLNPTQSSGQSAAQPTRTNKSPTSLPSTSTTGPLQPAPISTPSAQPASQPVRITPPPVSLPSAPMSGRLLLGWLISSSAQLVRRIRPYFKYVIALIIGLILINAIVSAFTEIIASQNSSQPATAIEQSTPTIVQVTATQIRVTQTQVPATPTTAIIAATCVPEDIISSSWPMLNPSLYAQLRVATFGSTVASRYGPVLNITSQLVPNTETAQSPVKLIEACGSGYGGLIDLNDTQTSNYLGCTSDTCNLQHITPVMFAHDVLIRRNDLRTINVSGRASLLEQLLQRPTNTAELSVIMLRQSNFDQQSFANMVLPLLQKPLVVIRNNTAIWHNMQQRIDSVTIPNTTPWYSPSQQIVTTSVSTPIAQVTHVVDVTGLKWQDATQIKATDYKSWFDGCASRNDQHPACVYVDTVRATGTTLTITYLPGIPEDMAETIAPYAIRGGGSSTEALLRSSTTKLEVQLPFETTQHVLKSDQYQITIETFTDLQQFNTRLRRNDTQIAIVDDEFAHQLVALLVSDPLNSDAQIDLVPNGGVYVFENTQE
ncbi:MAG: hypothetical protein FJ040_07820, partial [Chloroflexi bacterium]|nr:hypothetical protein [Chloroflexota bacterium]